jgi:L-asparaginase II
VIVEVRRGGVLEAQHRIHAAWSDGEVVCGDDLTCLLRSVVKPLQAVPLLEAYDDLSDAEIAIACASHIAEPGQIKAVLTLLTRAGATESDLECGAEGAAGKVAHNCSGKHAGMLAACRVNGWAFSGYSRAEHPLQRRIAEVIGRPPAATDGCGVPTFATTVRSAADLFARIPERARVAMAVHPELVGGTDVDDTLLMQLRPGWVAKRGAEALFCVSSPEGRALALKVEDGAMRAVRPALGAILDIDEWREVPLRSSLGDVVGVLSAVTR